MFPDYYQILRVSPHATPQQIRAAYRRRAQQLHPEAGGDPQQFRVRQEAYDLLMDPTRRCHYDGAREAPSQPSSFAEPLLPEDRATAEPLRRFRLLFFV